MAATATTRFLGIDFAALSRAQVMDGLLAASRDGRYGYVVTPNVDHIVKLYDGAIPRADYLGAALTLCDSRIVARLARFAGVTLDVHPGSDLVCAIFDDPRFAARRIAIAGASAEQFARLSALLPGYDLSFIDVPMLTVGSDDWHRSLAAAAAAEWDLALLCFSFPKQEMFAHQLTALRDRGGLALCVGASIDFITGDQTRAPRAMQRLHMEWLYRLATNPARLWRRYLVDGPRIFRIYHQVEVKGRKRG